MEKKEQFAKLDNLIGELGLKSDEVVAYLQKKGQSEKPKDLSTITLLPAKKIIMPNVIEVGMYLYEDGLISPKIIKGNQITSVIGHVDKYGGLAVCLKQRQLPWSSDLLAASLYPSLYTVGNTGDIWFYCNESKDPDIPSGKMLTKMIVEEARLQGKRAEAAEYCYTYAYDGVKAGEAFLPSKEEMDCVYGNCQATIDYAFRKLHAAPMCSCYWTSFESMNGKALLKSRLNLLQVNKDDDVHYVRPFLSFTF